VAAAELAEWPVDRAFAVFPFTQRLTLRIIVRVVFGMTGETGRRMEDAIRRLAPGAWPLVFPQLRRLPGDGAPWRRFLRARADMDALIREELRRRVVGGDAGDADVMSLLLRAYAEQDEALDPQLVRDELVTLLIAGHETTGSGLAWTFERLSRHPDAVAKARAGLEGGDESYTDNVVRETLRSRPPLRMCVRRVREPTEVGGFRVEPGASLGLGIALIHHRPDLYPEPERFRPERFAEGAPETYSWIPFGGGVRRCLGAAFASQEMKVVIGQALRRFDIVADPRPGERLRRRAITWIPHRGGEIRLRLRAG
jgi:cytochrome P450